MYIKKWKVIKFSIIYNIQNKGLIPIQLSQSVVNLFIRYKDSSETNSTNYSQKFVLICDKLPLNF